MPPFWRNTTIDAGPFAPYLAAMAKKATSSAPSQRMLRVGERVRHELSALLARGEIIDPLIETVTITVPEVRMSTDLRLANCYVMPLGGGNAEDVAKALNTHAKFIRGRITPALGLKFAPEFRFLVDQTFDEYGRIDAILRSDRVQRDLARDDEDDTEQ
ncbi:ribosome-binding factor A [Pelagibacterium luteolum]|uniref:Ribosome-binding factor A n=2 Tax=Pelagibacterium luteolum TaxID=440168 RepID=A0A1G7SQ46_9HYPH|nr:ribosome-binding factor A [Pelagibacterium luteolum]